MDRVLEHKEIHLLYSPKSRLHTFPDVGWDFLIHIAINIASVFSLIHRYGYVIGDINARSILVSKQGTIKLIDCDSFQIRNGPEVFTCNVGVPEFTPPEFQGKSLHGLVRDENNDAFGLAALIFHLLFMGRHPFAGEYLGTGNKDLADSIREYRFAYGSGAASRQVRQPPVSPSLEIVSPLIAGLFERAFTSPVNRPSSSEWLSALKELSQNLTKCQINSNHQYQRTLPACPWCKFESIGIKYFLGHILGSVWQSSFNLNKVWQEITGITFPPDLPTPSTAVNKAQNFLTQTLELLRIKSLSGVNPISSHEIFSVSQILLFANIFLGFWFILAIQGILGPVNTGILGPLVGSGWAIYCQLRLKRVSDKIKEMFNQADARQRNNQWLTTVQNEKLAFETKLRELTKSRQQYINLPNERLRRLADLEKNVRQRQFEKYLESFQIYDAQIPSIGSNRKAVLASYGIETAADIVRNKIEGVICGFGPVNTSKLIAWRMSLESRFVFNSNKGIDPADRHAIEQEAELRKRGLEADLITGPVRLKQIVEKIRYAQEQVTKLYEQNSGRLEEIARSEGLLKVLRYWVAPLWLMTIVLFWRWGIISSTQNTQITKPPDITASVYPVLPPQLPTQEVKLNQDLAKSFYRQGVGLTRTRQFERAVLIYQQAVSADPHYAEAYHELGYALLRLLRYDEAISACQRAIELRPFADTYRNLAGCYRGKRDLSGEVFALKSAITLEPNHLETVLQLADALFEKGDFDQAQVSYVNALRLSPDLDTAYYKLGLTWVRMGEIKKARMILDNLNNLNPVLASDLEAEIKKAER